jgi:hypothetical protein
VLDVQSQALKPIGTGEMSVVIAPDGPLRSDWLFVKHSAHERAFENVPGFDIDIDVLKPGGVFLEEMVRGGFNFVESCAEREKPRVGVGVEGLEKAAGEVRMRAIAEDANRNGEAEERD